MYKGHRFNSTTHLFGAALMLAGGAVLVNFAAMDGDIRKTVSYSVYAFTLFLLYLISTLYYNLADPAKRIFQVLDHQAIYLLIAGTYTPFTLVALKGIMGGWMFGTIYGLAVFRIVLDALPSRGCSDHYLSSHVLALPVRPRLDGYHPASREFSLAASGWDFLHVRHRVLRS